MEMLLYQSTQFRDVKKILDRAHGFAGLLTAGGIEASRLDVPFVCDQKVLSPSGMTMRAADVRRILTMQLGPAAAEGLFHSAGGRGPRGAFFAAVRPAADAGLPGTQKRARTQADIQTLAARSHRGTPTP